MAIASRASTFAIAVCVVLLAVGCGGHDRAILLKGIQMGDGSRVVISDGRALSARSTAHADWSREIATRARTAEAERFDNVRRPIFVSRLHRSATRYHFSVVAVTFRRPRELAPQVVVTTSHYVELSNALPRILRSLDPIRRDGDTARSAYEAIYFEARDERGIPFVITWNALRGKDDIGSQFARSEELYPFPHG